MCGIPVILVSLLIMLCTKDAVKMNGAQEKTETLVGQIKILVAFLQIISSLPSVMDGIPWPKIWVDMAIPFTALNIDVMGFGSIAACSISMLFPERFVLHMLTPVLYTLAAYVAYLLSLVFKRPKSSDSKKNRTGVLSKLVIAGILLLYPGLATKIFTMFRCKHYAGVEGQLLEIDFTVISQNISKLKTH